MAVQILLVDDHTMFRQGLGRILQVEPGFEVVGEAEDGEAACRLAKELAPDVVLMDIHMPRMSGIRATQTIMQQPDPPAIIVLTMSEDDEHIVEAMRYGARGYFLKNKDADQLVSAIHAVLGGKTILEPELAQRVLREFRQGPGKQRARKVPTDEFDDREIEILQGVARGWTNRDIAQHLDLSEKTIKNQLSAIFRRLNVDNRTQAAVYAIRTGIVPIEELG